MEGGDAGVKRKSDEDAPSEVPKGSKVARLSELQNLNSPEFAGEPGSLTLNSPLRSPEEDPDVLVVNSREEPDDDPDVLVSNSKEGLEDPDVLVTNSKGVSSELGSAPLELTSAPLELTSAPMELGSAPMEFGSAPLELGSAPLNSPEHSPDQLAALDPVNTKEIPDDAQVATNAPAKEATNLAADSTMLGDGDAEDEDEWDLDWDARNKRDAEILARIQQEENQVEQGWEKEAWSKNEMPEEESTVALPALDQTDDKGKWENEGGNEKKEEEELDENAAWAALHTKQETGKEAPEGGEEVEYGKVEPDVGYEAPWHPNSYETMVASVLVQKIRARANNENLEGGAFPSEEAEDLFKKYAHGEKKQQRILVCALQWVESLVLEARVIPPHLSEAAMSLLNNESSTLWQVCNRVPDSIMRTKAGSEIPPFQLRKDVHSSVEQLIGALHRKLTANNVDLGDEQELLEIAKDVLGHMPHTVRLMSLVHAFEYVEITKGTCYATDEDLAVALTKQCMPERAIEVTSRLSLQKAMNLVQGLLDDESNGTVMTKFRTAKINALNRIAKAWKLTPTEEQMAQLHVLDMERQLQVLLNVERDVEVRWCELLGKEKSQEEVGKKLRSFLNFDKLIQPYLREEDKERLPSKRLEVESGMKFEVMQLAEVREGIEKVLKALRISYQWSPQSRVRRNISKANWVARLSSLMSLANASDILDADKELARLLRQEVFRKLGPEVLDRFAAWNKLHGDGTDKRGGLCRQRIVKDVDRIKKMYNDFEPPERHTPSTPGQIGLVRPSPYTPGVGAMVRPAGTPGGPPPHTPAGPRSMSAAGTPAGMPPPTPAMRIGGFMTPTGPPPATPGFGGQARAAGTPVGPPPLTPAMRSAAAGTPAGPPPMTPVAPMGQQVKQPMGLPVPSTPVDAFSQPRAAAGTPAGPPPMTPAGFGGQVKQPVGMPAPSTPFDAFPSEAKKESGAATGLGAPAPSTPWEQLSRGPAAIPGTPMVTTPRRSMVPSTPAAVLGGAGATPQRVPSTPFDALPGTPAPRSSGAGPSMPFTPAGPAPATAARGAAPFTPAGPSPAGNVQPFTPAGPPPPTPAMQAMQAQPFTPGGPSHAAQPFTPAGPVPGSAQPFTPAGPMPTSAMPFTPAGVVRETSSPVSARSPATVSVAPTPGAAPASAAVPATPR